jgi:2-polyprenyl-6-methoxyphenol hydroxylase-like FAD-dependent oxidoreductase
MMASATNTDVLICGAGPAGLTLAVELARRNVDFVLVDKAAHPFVGSRGKGVQPRTQEIYEDLGVLDRMVAAGGEYPLQRFYTADGPVDKPAGETPTPSLAEPYQITRLVPQFLTERCLRDRLSELGHAPQFGCELVGLEQDEHGVTAHVQTPQCEHVVRAQYLIGADGGSSFVRKALGVEFPSESLNVYAVVADLFVDGVSTDVWHRWSQGTPKQTALCPLRGTDMFQLLGPIPAEADVDLTPAGLTGFIHERTGRDDIVVREVSWASVFEMRKGLADSYQVGRGFLIGDAAHCHPPTGAQGLNTSVQDAYNIGWKIAAVLNGAPATLLSTYQQERRPIAESVLGLSQRLLQQGSAERGREVRQLDLGYPESDLNIAGESRNNGVQAGDRAPDALLRGAGGQPRRLFDLLHGTHWTLLGHEVDRSSQPEPRRGLHIHTTGHGGDLIDDENHLATFYGLQADEWVLIRPDGYVAAIVTTPNLTAIATYLDNVGVHSIDPSTRNGENHA